MSSGIFVLLSGLGLACRATIIPQGTPLAPFLRPDPIKTLKDEAKPAGTSLAPPFTAETHTEGALIMATAALPSGPRGRFFSGNLPDFRRDPLGFITMCARQYGDFVPVRFGPVPGFLLNHPDYIEQVLVVNSGNFTKSRALQRSRFLLGNGLLTSEGDFWMRQRRLAQPAFHRQRVAAYGDVMVRCTRRALEGWRDGEDRDIHAEMMRLTLGIVAKTLFGADVSGEAEAIGEAMGLLVGEFSSRTRSLFQLPDQIPTPGNLRARRAVGQLEKVIYRIIERRRAGGEDPGDLLSMLLQARDEDGSGMTDTQLRDEVMTLFLAGHETTAIALSWTFYLLSQHPEAESRLLAELQEVLDGRPPTASDTPRLRYVESVVSESLRLYPPAWAMGRSVVGDCEIGGYRVPAGSFVLMSQWLMHRDPRYFDRPGEFIPDRWADGLAKRLPRFAYFPFGGGPRMCIGSSFALMEAALVLATVAQTFHLDLVPGHPMVPEPSITLRPRYGVRMTLHRR